MKPALEAPHLKVHDCAQSFVLCSHNLAELRSRHVSYWLVPRVLMTHCALRTVRAKKANKNIEKRILPSFITIYLH